jgi:hypothetical protein
LGFVQAPGDLDAAICGSHFEWAGYRCATSGVNAQLRWRVLQGQAFQSHGSLLVSKERCDRPDKSSSLRDDEYKCLTREERGMGSRP